MMLSTTFVFIFYTIICAVNSDSKDEVEGAGVMFVKKTMISGELPNNKTVVVMTLQENAVEMQILPPPKPEDDQGKTKIQPYYSPLGPNTLFGWQDLTRYNEARKQKESNASKRPD